MYYGCVRMEYEGISVYFICGYLILYVIGSDFVIRIKFKIRLDFLIVMYCFDVFNR